MRKKHYPLHLYLPLIEVFFSLSSMLPIPNKDKDEQAIIYNNFQIQNIQQNNYYSVPEPIQQQSIQEQNNQLKQI